MLPEKKKWAKWHDFRNISGIALLKAMEEIENWLRQWIVSHCSPSFRPPAFLPVMMEKPHQKFNLVSWSQPNLSCRIIFESEYVKWGIAYKVWRRPFQRKTCNLTDQKGRTKDVCELIKNKLLLCVTGE